VRGSGAAAVRHRWSAGGPGPYNPLVRNKRERIASSLSRVGLAGALLALRRRLPAHCLTVLTYHRVNRPEAAGDTDAAVVDATPEQFDEQLAFLAAHFSAVRIADLVRFVDGVGQLPANPLLITFDDAYRDCYTEALPRLLRHGLPATFFVPTAYVSERRLFWWDHIAYLCKHSRRQQLELGYPQRLRLDLRGGPQAAIDICLDLVKRHHGLDLSRFLAELERGCGVVLDRARERAMVEAALMTWDQIRALRDAGMDIQSHTRHHRVLQTLPPPQLREELAAGRRDLEAQLGTPVEAIAYPVGAPVTGQAELRAAVAEAGFRLGFSNGTGVSLTWPRPDPLDLRRIALDRDIGGGFFAGLLALPILAWRR
jgi:peptidoglycan/xylan/chitin deacetylase (PgdA/CDA1 family)